MACSGGACACACTKKTQPSQNLPQKSLESRIAEAASDYKCGLKNDGFAAVYGGIDKLRSELFALVDEWEGEQENDSVQMLLNLDRV